jgi:transposase
VAVDAKDSLIIELKDIIQKQNIIIEEQRKQNLALQELVRNQAAEIKNLKEQVDYLTKKLFGTSSEKSKDIEGQLSLFNEAEQTADFVDELPEELQDEELTALKTRKPKRKRADLFKGVPVKEEIIELPEDKRNCAVCDAPLERIGKEFVRQEFRYIPAKGELVNIYKATYKCPACADAEELEDSIQIIKADVPKALIPNSYATDSSVAYTIYQKYANGMPLYRQEKDLAQLGANIPRTTLANWIITCSNEYFQPLYEYFHRKLLERSFLMADETRVQVLKEKDRKPQQDSFMWLFRSGKDGLAPIILYWYAQTRAKYNAEEYLKGFDGYLMSDAYSGYNNLPGITRCACWAHLRRDFLDAIPKGKEKDLRNPAVQGAQYCTKLFEYERISREKKHTYEERKEYRLLKEKPILDAFWEWLSEQKPTKGSRFDKAVNYAINRRPYAENYLKDGRCSLSNN